MNLADANFQPAPCMPCGPAAPHPTACSCALLIPVGLSPYASVAIANTAIADQVFSCVAYFAQPGTVYSLSVVLSVANQITLTSSDNGTNAYVVMSINLKSGSTVSIAWSSSVSGDLGSATLDDCNFTTYSSGISIHGTSGSGSFSTISADGEYYIVIPVAGTTAAQFVISCDNTMTANPVIALWDDSGTTRQLWACPKLLLPPLTESTGDWYADCASAHDTTIAVFTSNCVGYADSFDNTNFTATDGGTSLQFDVASFIPLGDTGGLWGGINLVAGQTVTVTTSSDASGASDVVAILYDDTGTLVEDFSATSTSTATSSAVPYTGRYTIKIGLVNSGGFTTATLTITSSGTMSVNPIAAAWDNGLTCPSYLNCGDSCP